MASCIEVVIPPTTYCSGSCVEGEVRLNFRLLQQSETRFEKLWVTLRGRALCVCSDSDSSESETTPLVDLSRVLWTHGSQYPPPDSDVLRLFFRFQLPEDIPPSLLDDGPGGTGAVLYSLTTVAVRPGGSTKPWKQHTPIVVVPRDDVSPLLTQSLASTATVWRTAHKEKKVRKKLWGDYATVRIELSIPDVPVLPLFTPIPFKIDISTITATLTRRTDGHRDSAHAPIFPTPPAAASEFSVQLIRRTKVRVKKREETLRSVRVCTPRKHDDVVVPEKEWVPMQDTSVSTSSSSHSRSNKETGVWVQCAQFTSRLVLNVSPTFSVGDRLEWEYRLKIKVPFSGVGNDVELEMPVTIVSGISKPVPRKQPQLRLHDPRLSGWCPPNSEMSLPWEYWQGQGTWVWNEFNKGIDAQVPTA
ncbi:hypothetical protein C8T65DRAFT_729501, partial [Cerioporus squamosus]